MLRQTVEGLLSEAPNLCTLLGEFDVLLRNTAARCLLLAQLWCTRARDTLYPAFFFSSRASRIVASLCCGGVRFRQSGNTSVCADENRPCMA